MKFRSLLLALVAAGMLTFAGVVSIAWAQDATPTPVDHAAHHATADAAGSMAGMAMTDTMESMVMTETMPSMPMTDTTAMPGMDHSAHHPAGGAASAMENMPMTGTMAGHGMDPIPSAGVPVATQAVGGQPLAPEVEDGVKVFRLTAEPVIWNITDNVTVTAWTYNGSVPGPMLRATEGDKVRVILTNKLPEATTIHWHGIDVPNSMDGVPGMPSAAIQPGETFTYAFTVNTPGSYMYHSHTASDKQVSVGLYAPFIIDPATPPADEPAVDASLMFSEWRVVDGQTYPAMPMAGAEPNYFTINGKAFPATEKLQAKVGEPIRLRLMNIGQFVHPIHVHGASFKVVATDGHPVPEAAQLTKDTISISPGERYDIEMVFKEPGQWMVHCHILHHTTNNGADEGGMMLVIDVTE